MSEMEYRPPPVTGLERYLERPARVTALVAGTLCVVMMILTVVDIAMRATQKKSIPGLLEYSEVALVLIVFIGMMSAEVTRTHVRTPILVSRLPIRAALVSRLTGLVVATAFVVWVTIATALAASESIARGEYRFGLTAVPIWPAKLAIPLGFGALALALLAQVADRFLELRTLLQDGSRENTELKAGVS